MEYISAPIARATLTPSNTGIPQKVQIRLATIGYGIQGTGDTAGAQEVDGVEFVAACDLYDGRLQNAKERYGKQMFEHVWFGHYRFAEGKMSTRKGNVIFMEDVLNKSIELVEKIIEEKNPDLKNKKRVAQMVGVGAIAFGDLFNDRIKNITFDWDKILDFNGDTGPYLQYTHARCCSILRKADRFEESTYICSILRVSEK